MSDIYMLSEAQMRRIISGIIYVIKQGLMWRNASMAYGPNMVQNLPQKRRNRTNAGGVKVVHLCCSSRLQGGHKDLCHGIVFEGSCCLL